jgi:hypothetical protein
VEYGNWPKRADYRLQDAAGETIAHGLDAKTAYAMAIAGAANGQDRRVITPDGVVKSFPAGTDPAYRAYLDRWPNVIDPRD